MTAEAAPETKEPAAGEDAPAPAAPSSVLPPKAPALWIAGVVAFVGLAELVLHVGQVSARDPSGDYATLAASVRKEQKADDLLVFAPLWTDPVGRQAFGDLATLDRAAFSDVTRYPRAFEVSRGGARHPDLLGFRVEAEEHAGDLTLRRLVNPAPETIVDDLLRHVGAGLEVSRHHANGKDDACPFTAGGAQAGPWDPSRPAQYYGCPGASVGVIVLVDAGYRPRRCLFAPPFGGSDALRLRFHDVTFGKAIVGHHGLHRVHEQQKTGAPVSAAFGVDAETPDGKIAERELGRVTHREGDGWTGFRVEVPPALVGQKGDLFADVTTAGASRYYCFEATTR